MRFPNIANNKFNKTMSFIKAIREQLDKIGSPTGLVVSDTPSLEFMKTIKEQLNKIGSSTSQVARNTLLSQQTQMSINTFEQNYDEEAFINSEHHLTNIYWQNIAKSGQTSKVIAPDINLENKPNILSQTKFNAMSVYEWSIDGMSEYNIINLLQQMTMAANAYKTQTGISYKAIVELLTAGFSGQLKSWWDYYLTEN